jgi:hypothetical protein
MHESYPDLATPPQGYTDCLVRDGRLVGLLQQASAALRLAVSNVDGVIPSNPAVSAFSRRMDEERRARAQAQHANLK